MSSFVGHLTFQWIKDTPIAQFHIIIWQDGTHYATNVGYFSSFSVEYTYRSTGHWILQSLYGHDYVASMTAVCKIYAILTHVLFLAISHGYHIAILVIWYYLWYKGTNS